MKTIVKTIEVLDEQGLKDIEEMAKLLNQGETVVFPTETVYGLGANAFDPRAIKKIFKAKGRPMDNPLIVHVAKKEDIFPLVDEISESAKKLMAVFWPGPLTLVMKKSPRVSKEVTGGLNTVAIRVPKHPIARAFIAAGKCPVAAPSANISGRPSPTRFKHVMDDLMERVGGMILSQDSEVGLESTVVDTTVEPPMILRPGDITYEDLKKVLGEVRVSENISNIDENMIPDKILSPGMKYTHYSPQGELFVVKGRQEEITQKINGFLKKHKGNKMNIGILACDETMNHYKEGLILSLGSILDPKEMGRNIFAALRTFDELGVLKIYAEDISLNNETLALINRLYKAAGYQFL